MGADVISVVLEYIPSVKQMLKLRLVSKVFDTAAFRITLVKLHQARTIQARFTREVEAFDPNNVLENLSLHLNTLECRREKLLNKLNTGQSVCEFYSYSKPPDYIFYVGEALGEASGLIPKRVEHSQRHLSREDRWKEIHAMFRAHDVILSLMDVDPRLIKEEGFYALKALQARPEVIEQANKLRSFAFQFYFLALTFLQIN